MSDQIIGLHQWLQTPPGRYLLEWEHERYDQTVSDIFGYHSLQLGMPALQALRTNRMPYRWVAASSSAEMKAFTHQPLQITPPPGALDHNPSPVLITDSAALPFASGSLDLVLLPHTLELSADPHATLREVERVLVPEGRVVISCLNPASLWGLCQRRARLYQRLGFGEPYLPEAGEFLGYWRLRDWLRLLNFEVESSRFGCYRPAVRSAAWLQRFAWMDTVGDRSWNIFGAAYFLVAVKRVHGIRLLTPPWKKSNTAVQAPVPAVSRENRKMPPTIPPRKPQA